MAKLLSTTDDAPAKELWAVAEQAATQYGDERALRYGLEPSQAEVMFLIAGELYRLGLTSESNEELLGPGLSDPR